MGKIVTGEASKKLIEYLSDDQICHIRLTSLQAEKFITTPHLSRLAADLPH